LKKNIIENLSEKMDLKSLIPQTEQDWLLKHVKKIQLDKNEYLLRAGEIPKYAGMNISGLLRLYYIDDEGCEITKHFCTVNSLAISYSAFVNQTESNFFIQALESTTLLAVDYSTYIKTLEHNQCWKIANGKLTELLFTIKEKRESELLLKNAEERYQQFIMDFPDLHNTLPVYLIASYLAIKPESLSRIRSQMKKLDSNLL
jgi:CRP-like cAMP-binding protein